MHVHVHHAEGEAKFWLAPHIALAKHNKLSSKQLNKIEKIIEEHYDEIVKAWNRHFDH